MPKNEICLPMPITVAPFAHQQAAFNFTCKKFGLLPGATLSRGVALLMEMGTGKTLVAIAIAGYLFQHRLVTRVLIVAPLSVVGVWEEEFAKFAGFQYSLTILKGTSAKKKAESIISESASSLAWLTELTRPSSSVRWPPVIWDSRRSRVRMLAVVTSVSSSLA